MRGFLIILITIFVVQGQLLAQSCFPEGLFLNSQREIDHFSTEYPNCIKILGNLTIQGENISNLDGLSQLTSIKGELLILANPKLESISGLNNITHIGDDVLVINNPKLQNLNGLSNLTTIEANLYIGYDELINGGGNSSLKDLHGLDRLTRINGSLYISHNDSLLDLSGLNQVRYIGDMVRISSNKRLKSLSGLGLSSIETHLIICFNSSLQNLIGIDNITTIGSDFHIYGNDELKNLEGLESLRIIGEELRLENNPLLSDISVLRELQALESLYISENTSLMSISGLENISELEGSLNIRECHLLKDFNGLKNLNTIGEDFTIWDNDGIKNFMSFNQLLSVGGNIGISDNDSLINLYGLEHIETNAGTRLYIKDNISLSVCGVQSICNYLTEENGDIFISTNAPGCNYEYQVRQSCENLNCFPDGLSISSEEDLTDFQTFYPECTTIGGSLSIDGNDITDLSFLNSLKTIDGDLIITNTTLENLLGLDSLIALHGNLIIGDNTEGGNAILKSLEGISNLIYLEGELKIENNDILHSIEHLDIDLDDKNDLSIRNNPALSVCDNNQICEYLEGSIGYVRIENNAMGCNSIEEVRESCALGTNEAYQESEFMIYPNPAQNSISINSNHYNIGIHIYNELGQLVLQEMNANNEIDISKLYNGIYIIQISSGELVIRKKLLVRK